MAKMKKGSRLVCVPCGREVIVDACGVSQQTIWCCGKPMASRKASSKKSSGRKRAGRK